MIVDPNTVQELSEETGKSESECIDSIMASNTYEEALNKLNEINIIELRKKVRVGSIVVIENPRLSFHKKVRITKVIALTKPGVKSKSKLKLDTIDKDLTEAFYNTKHVSSLSNAIIVLEDFNSTQAVFKYLNKNCFIEYLGALRLATPKEKKKYYKHKQGRG